MGWSEGCEEHAWASKNLYPEAWVEFGGWKTEGMTLRYGPNKSSFSVLGIKRLTHPYFIGFLGRVTDLMTYFSLPVTGQLSWSTCLLGSSKADAETVRSTKGLVKMSPVRGTEGHRLGRRCSVFMHNQQGSSHQGGCPLTDVHDMAIPLSFSGSFPRRAWVGLKGEGQDRNLKEQRIGVAEPLSCVGHHKLQVH
jgi:hypothetical protein